MIGVRSWWEASATNWRWLCRASSSLPVIRLKARASVRCSLEPVGGTRSLRSPAAIRSADSVIAFSGAVSSRATITAAISPIASTTTAISASPPTESRTACDSASVLCVIRTAPTTSPSAIIGAEVAVRSMSRVVLSRSPWNDCPARADWISGRLE